MARQPSKRGRSSGRWSRLAKRLGVLVVSLILSLVVVEMGLRWLYPQAATGFSRRLFITGPKGLIFLKPEESGTHLGREFEVHIQANRDGYRDEEWTAKPAGDSRKILFLGDSYVFGWGVPQERCFVSLLQQATGQAIYNAAMPGDGFREYVARAELHLPKVRPDVVVLCVYVNDFTQLLHPEYTEGKTAGKEEPILYRIKKAVQDMHLYRLGYRALRGNRLVARMVGRAYYDDLLRAIFQEEFRLYTKRDGLLDQVWPQAQGHLRRIKELCETHGSSLVLLNLPPWYAVDAGPRRRLLKLTGLDPQELDFRRVAERLREFCSSAGVTFLDPSDRIEAALADGETIYFSLDMHLTARGHEVVAGFLADAMPRGG